VVEGAAAAAAVVVRLQVLGGLVLFVWVRRSSCGFGSARTRVFGLDAHDGLIGC